MLLASCINDWEGRMAVLLKINSRDCRQRVLVSGSDGPSVWQLHRRKQGGHQNLRRQAAPGVLRCTACLLCRRLGCLQHCKS